jgi:hypothetical protein
MRKPMFATTVVLFAACGGSSTEPKAGPAAQLVIVAGGSQTGIFRQATTVVPTVLVTDAKNRPVPDVAVAFTLSAGGGTVAVGNATTDANGNAGPGSWILGSTFGQKVLTATVANLPAVRFTVTAFAPDAGINVFTLTDAANDTIPSASTGMPKAADILSIRGDFKRDSMILTVTFAGPVSPSRDSLPTSITGFIEFDLDDNASTGFSPFSNSFGGSAAIGVDHVLSFSSAGTTMLVGPAAGAAPTSVPVAFTGNVIVVRIPMFAFGNDDGNFTMVGVIGTLDRPTDLFPNTGSNPVRPTVDVVTAQRAFSPKAGSVLEPRVSWSRATSHFR